MIQHTFVNVGFNQFFFFKLSTWQRLKSRKLYAILPTCTEIDFNNTFNLIMLHQLNNYWNINCRLSTALESTLIFFRTSLQSRITFSAIFYIDIFLYILAQYGSLISK